MRAFSLVLALLAGCGEGPLSDEDAAALDALGALRAEELDEAHAAEPGDARRGRDYDGDGYTIATGDCNERSARINPGATEVYDGVDNDCDGLVDERTSRTDADGDGVAAGRDCDDGNAAVYPGAPEVADGVDNDCDGVIDERTRSDADGDGYGSDTDCDDGDAATYPGAPDRTGDGIDRDCDGVDG